MHELIFDPELAQTCSSEEEPMRFLGGQEPEWGGKGWQGLRSACGSE